MNYAVMLAGGTGTRFWPLSRKNEPKQFLNLCSKKPMIEETVNRIKKIIPPNRTFIATNKIYHKNISSCLARLKVPLENVLFEPESKNTFAPIAVLAKKIYEFDKEAVILVMPSDHYIKEKGSFLKVLGFAITAAENGHICTIGIAPDRPETGYGYIKINIKSGGKRSNIYKVSRFIEKPNLKTAKKFIKDKSYYWNGGIFIFKAGILLEEIKNILPGDYSFIMRIKDQKSMNNFWPKLTSTSIDYAVMEKSRRLVAVPAEFSLFDLGSWKSMESLYSKDKKGNIFRGDCIDIGSMNTIALSIGSRLLATIGLDNLIVINTEDATLVCHKDKSQDVKKIVQLLKQKKFYKQI